LASVVLLALAVVSAGGGCASESKQPQGNARLNSWLAGREAELPPAEYRIQSPDELLVSAPGIKELDAQQVTVRPDGKISLNLVGEVDAADRTPEQIAAEIRQRVRKFYDKERLDVSVQVAEFKSRVVYVFGQVDEPGTKPFTGRDTVLHVLAEARLNQEAWPEKIVVVRPNEDPNVKQRVTVDVKRMWETGELDQNFVLEEGDVVYVPPSPLAQVNRTFDRLLSPIKPTLSVFSWMRFGG
jgi:protein involved in polysaccharide export with SLBB domain